MKQTFLLFCGLMFTLSGCVFYSRANVIAETDKKAKERYEYFTTNKTMAKAFEAYEWLDIDGTAYNAGSEDFEGRFCDIDNFFDMYMKNAIRTELGEGYDNGVETLTKIKTFQILGNLDSKTKVSDEDARCLALKCDYTTSWYDMKMRREIRFGNWVNHDDECIVRRRSLLNNEELTEWNAFNYKDYIPEYAKIGTYKKFIDLYHAYKEDIEDCEEQRKQLKITSIEYDNCLQSVENKMEQIVKSGVLQ